MNAPNGPSGDPPELTREQTRWALAASVLFLIAVGFLGFAFASGALFSLAAGWLALQMFGYVGALRFAHGDLAHPLFKSQVMLHAIAFVLIIGMLTRGG